MSGYKTSVRGEDARQKVEEKWKIKKYLPPLKIPVFISLSYDLVEVEEKI